MVKLFGKRLLALSCTCALVTSLVGCQVQLEEPLESVASSEQVQQSSHENTVEGKATTTSEGQESSTPDPQASRGSDSEVEGYTDITETVFAALEDEAHSYQLLYANSSVLLLYHTQWYARPEADFPSVRSRTYSLCAVDPETLTVVASKTLEDTFGFLRVKGDRILLLEDDKVAVMGSGLELLQEFPVPQTVQQGIRNSTIVPYNEVGSGYNPRDHQPKYDVSSDFIHFIYTNDEGLFGYSTVSGTIEDLLAFPPPTEFLGMPYYDGHFYAPSFSEDEKMIEGIAVAQPKSGAHYSWDAVFDVETGQLSMDQPYYFTEQYELDSYVNSRLPCAPLAYLTSLGDGTAIFWNGPLTHSPQRFYRGLDMDVESLIESLTSEFYDQKTAE